VPTFEPTFVAVVGESEAALRPLVRGLVAALRAIGVSATSVKVGPQPPRCDDRSAARFWENDVVFVEGFGSTGLPRIVLADPGGLAANPLACSGDVVAIVEPPEPAGGGSWRADLLEEIALRIAARFARADGAQAPRSHASDARGRSSGWRAASIARIPSRQGILQGPSRC
jgi:hypothetical protein